MRTTVELPDELLAQARHDAASEGITLRQFFIDAVRAKLTSSKRKTRKPPPSVGDKHAPPLPLLTREQIDEAMFS